ncbi:MAG: hypothetical protein IT293_16395 [Deltaproteobacteria bacterium]|nr:hypothetical protein [Deltaproteobacteria bacterium]
MKAHRLPVLALAFAALAAGIATGLRRIGWEVVGPGAAYPIDHGPLMIAGFLGTLIGLERAVALGRAWVYAGPIASGLGVLAHVAGAPAIVAPAGATIGSLVLVSALTSVVAARPTLFLGVMTCGAACWMVGNLFWLGGAASPAYVSWWVTFLVLTIAAERLELTRLLPAARGSRESFVAVATLLLVSVAAGGVGGPTSARATGLALAALAAWLGRYDLARRTVRQHGLPRFTAVCLLSGYAWLAAAGILLVGGGAVVAGPQYDAVLHAVFLGFVFAMIFGHAPIVFPAVLGVAIPFHRAFYAHLALLHASLLARLVADIADAASIRQWAALLNAAAIALFFANTIAAVVRGRLHDSR